MTQTLTLAVDRIIPNPEQPRRVFDPAALQELADSIRAHGGVVQPIIVTPNGSASSFLIVDGERRWRAAQLAGLKTIDAVVKNKLEAQQMLEQAFLANLHRADLNPIEEAQVYRRLMDEFGLKVGDISARTGKAVSVIYNAMSWLKLDEPIQDLVAARALHKDFRLATALAALPAAVAIPLAQKLADRKVSLKASLAACAKAAEQLADQAQGETSPLRRRATRRAEHTPGVADGWALEDVRAAAKRMCAQCEIKTETLKNQVAEPGWILLVHAADQTCAACSIREVKGACDSCPGVDLLQRLVEMSKIKHDLQVKTKKA